MGEEGSPLIKVGGKSKYVSRNGRSIFEGKQ